MCMSPIIRIYEYEMHSELCIWPLKRCLIHVHRFIKERKKEKKKEKLLNAST